MEDLKFQQRWLVVDVATTAELNQWEGVHQVCDPHRAATYMRIGDTRYRWEFRLLPDETADDYNTMAALYPLIRPWVEGVAPEQLELVRVGEYTFRAQVAEPLAPWQHLHPWRRRPPDTAVHRPGPVRGPARRDEPRVEACRRGQRLAAGECA